MPWQTQNERKCGHRKEEEGMKVCSIFLELGGERGGSFVVAMVTVLGYNICP